VLRDGPVPIYDPRCDIWGLRTDRLENEGIVMRCGLTPTDAMHLKGDFDEFDTNASRLGAQCVLKMYRGEVVAEADEAIAELADEIYNLARFRLYNQVVRAFAQDHYWPDEAFDLDDQMATIVKRSWDDRSSETPAAFNIRFESDAALVGVGAPTHVFLGEVAEALHAPCSVPKYAGVANAVGAAASRIVVEQQVRVSPLRGPDGVVQGYLVRGLDWTDSFKEVDDALDAARKQARDRAFDEARRRGATGDLNCVLEEERSMYTAIGVYDAVREWTITARID